MLRIPSNRMPTHPGEMLAEEFLKPLRLTQHELALALHVSPQRINALVQGRRGMTPSIALRLATYFGTSAEFWLLLQVRWEPYKVSHAAEAELNAPDPTIFFESPRH
jgi:addiction module HigA family antidote